MNYAINVCASYLSLTKAVINLDRIVDWIEIFVTFFTKFKLFNRNQGWVFCPSKRSVWGLNQPTRLWALSTLFSTQIKQTWYQMRTGIFILYVPIESLKTILCSIVFPSGVWIPGLYLGLVWGPRCLFRTPKSRLGSRCSLRGQELTYIPMCLSRDSILGTGLGLEPRCSFQGPRTLGWSKII